LVDLWTRATLESRKGKNAAIYIHGTDPSISQCKFAAK